MRLLSVGYKALEGRAKVTLERWVYNIYEESQMPGKNSRNFRVGHRTVVMAHLLFFIPFFIFPLLLLLLSKEMKNVEIENTRVE